MEIEFFDDFDEFEDVIVRLPKRYLRNERNPMDFYADVEFKGRYRFSKETVQHVLLRLIAPRLAKENLRGLPFTPLIMLLATLRFYATGYFQKVVGDLRGVSQPSIALIVKKVSVMFAEQLATFVFFPERGNQQRANIARFAAVHNFPCVAGCVDGTHIPISSPEGGHAEVYRNRKGIFSLNVQVVAGPNQEILDIVVRHPGSTHDNVIFDRSSVRVKFVEGHVSGLLLGDSGYGCRPYLLTPLLNPQTPNERRYNSAHKSTRNIVERVFGIWKRRFPCLTKIRAKVETAQAVICATAVLHNIGVRARDVVQVEEVVNVPELHPHQQDDNNNVLGLAFRRQFITQHF